MKQVLLTFILLAVTANSGAAEWYENLLPGVTRAEIISIAGQPSSSEEKTDRYYLPRGHLELSYNADEVLLECTHHNRPGSHIATHYYTSQFPLEASSIEARKAYLKEYLKAGEYLYLPKFDLPFIRTRRYDGVCYKVNDSYLVIEKILVFTGESGFYADKAAKVTLIDPNKNETVLYRAIDNWENLRPPQLTAKQVDERTNRLISMGTGASIGSIIEALGAPDSSMGSGFYYEVFYLKDALAVINRIILREITILLPGLEHISFEEWIRRQQNEKNSFPVSP